MGLVEFCNNILYYYRGIAGINSAHIRVEKHMKGKMVIFVILLMLLIGVVYAGNNTTEIEDDSHTIEYSDNVYNI